MTTNPAAQLCALVGITPETMPHLYHVESGCERHLGECTNWYEFDGPDPLSDDPAVDLVYLAPLIKFIRNKYRIELDVKPDFVHARIRLDQSYSRWSSWRTANNVTNNLIRAAQAAGVPEIVAIFGRDER